MSTYKNRIVNADFQLSRHRQPPFLLTICECLKADFLKEWLKFVILTM